MDWLKGYNKRRKITIPAGSVSEDLTDFPVLLHISENGSGITGVDTSDIIAPKDSVALYDDCNGAFSANWVDHSNLNSSAGFSGGNMILNLQSGNTNEGCNALTRSSFVCTGLFSIEFDWWPVPSSGWYDDDFTDGKNHIKIVNPNPQYNSSSWRYNECEYLTNTDSSLLLALRSNKSNKVTIRQRINGTVTTLLDHSFVYGTHHKVKWEVDFDYYTTEVLIDDNSMGGRVAWSASLLDYISDYFKYNFHWHSYVHTASQRYDNIIIRGNTTGLLQTAMMFEEQECFMEVAQQSSIDKEAWLWVKVPTVSSGTDTVLYLYYDNDPDIQVSPFVGGVSTVPAQNVWDDNFVAVYHMSSMSPALDSTSNEKHASSYNMGEGNLVDGKVGDALAFNGSDEYLRASNIEALPIVTVEANHYRYTGNNGDDMVISRYNYGPTEDGDFQIHTDATNTSVYMPYFTSPIVTPHTDEQWIYTVATYDTNTLKHYNDGSLVGTAATSFSSTTTYDWLIAGDEDYSGQTPGNLFKGIIDEVRISDIIRSQSWIDATYKTSNDNLIIFSDTEYLAGFTPPYPNMWITDDFIFKCVYNAIEVYDTNASGVGIIPVEQRPSSVWADDNYLYIGTTASGILRHPMTSISGGIYTDLIDYKQYPDITNNGVIYIHGAGDYLCATTVSGVDRIKISTDSHISSEYSADFGKCFQVNNGDMYYLTRLQQLNLPYDPKYYRRIDFTDLISRDDYQVEINFNYTNFDYDNLLLYGGGDIKFFDKHGNFVPYFIDAYSTSYTSIWLKPPFGIDYVYMTYGTRNTITESDPDSVFMLYDSFDSTVLDLNKWTVVGDLAKFSLDANKLTCTNGDHDYIVSSGTVTFPVIIEQYVKKDFGGSTNGVCYTNLLTPEDDGLYWFNDTAIARKIVFNTEQLPRPSLHRSEDNTYYTLSTLIDNNRIQMKVLKDDGTAYINDVWTGETSGLPDRHVKLFGGYSTASSTYVHLYWVRVRGYDYREISMKNFGEEHLVYHDNLNVVYNRNSDWTENDIDYVYAGNGSIFPTEVQINDLFVTGDTATTSGNTIFLATDNGVTVIEENRSDEINGNVKYFKTEI